MAEKKRPIQFTVAVLVTVDPEAYAAEYGLDPEKARRVSAIEEMTEFYSEFVREAARETMRPFDFVEVK